ncbi:MAG: HAD family phosphatase [Ferruginibacter sp.]
MAQNKAFIFDLNGTMINDMDFHIRAWHGILNSLGANVSLEETKLQCYGKNSDLLERMFPGRFSMDEMNVMSIEKEKRYQAEFRPYLKLIGGLDIFLEKARQHHIKMAIGTAAIMFNVDYILDGAGIRPYIDAIVSADDVIHSKPDPETFLKAAAWINADPADCIVFEDSPKGVEAATRAGMKSVVLTTMHTEDEFNDPGIICYTPDYNNGLFEKLIQ